MQDADIVALRKESVDRNRGFWITVSKQCVALRKESVDRNCGGVRLQSCIRPSLSARRAWIEMSVVGSECSQSLQSLSARRAWIEIAAIGSKSCLTSSLSARRAWIEITSYSSCDDLPPKSLSARRAWIEIVWLERSQSWERVALRKESVDRNPLER